jgi:hypothetical protein
MPITVPSHLVERYGGPDHFTKIYDALIGPAVEAAGLEPIPPSRSGTENIQAAIINDLQGADLVLADLSALNPNVFLELGIRSALDKPVCLVADGKDPLPFDAGTLFTHKYEPHPVYELNNEIAAMAEHVRSTVDKSDGRNELWKFFGAAAALPVAALEPEDATLSAKVDRLAELVESRLASPVPPPLRARPKRSEYAGALVEQELKAAGRQGLHGSSVGKLCREILGDAPYEEFVREAGTLSGALRGLGLDIYADSRGYFYLGSIEASDR